jgi:hypothetical protein
MDLWLILPALRSYLCGDLQLYSEDRTLPYPRSSLELMDSSILRRMSKPCILFEEIFLVACASALYSPPKRLPAEVSFA